MINIVPAVIAALPCLASVVLFVALFWSLTGGIDSEIFRVIMKGVILLGVIFIELAIFSNAMLPWLQYRTASKPVLMKEVT